jgi:hypothetical protein
MKYTPKSAGPEDETVGDGVQMSPGVEPELKHELLNRVVRLVNCAPALSTALLGMIL